MQNNDMILRHGLIIISERNIGSAACKAISKKIRPYSHDPAAGSDCFLFNYRAFLNAVVLEIPNDAFVYHLAADGYGHGGRAAYGRRCRDSAEATVDGYRSERISPLAGSAPTSAKARAVTFR